MENRGRQREASALLRSFDLTQAFAPPACFSTITSRSNTNRICQKFEWPLQPASRARPWRLQLSDNRNFAMRTARAPS